MIFKSIDLTDLTVALVFLASMHTKSEAKKKKNKKEDYRGKRRKNKEVT